MDKSRIEQVPWNIWDAGKAIVVLMFLVIGSSLFKLPFSGKRPLYSPQPVIVAGVMLLIYGILFLITWLFTIRKYKASFDALGFTSFDLLDGLIGTIFWLVVLIFFVYIYAVLASLIFHFEQPPELVEEVPRMFGTSRVGVALAVFFIVFIAPIVEEIFFRGFVYLAIRKRIRASGAIALSAVIFAIIHVNPWQFVPLVAIGVVLAYLYEEQGSLGPPIMLHCLNNMYYLARIYLFRT